MVSASDVAKCKVVSLIKLLAGVYGVSVDLKRDCTDESLRKAYRALSKQVHPDKGGKTEDQTRLNAVGRRVRC